MINENLREEIRQEFLAEQRAYKADWRVKNKDKIKESNRKYYEKKKAERAGDYRAYLKGSFPAYIGMMCEGKSFLLKYLPGDYEIRIYGIDSPLEKSVIEVGKNDKIICRCNNIEHSTLADVVNLLEKKVKWL